ncbi:putative nuclease HARBI1 isoform X1 [Rhagoletis pomonella]|uniref:putative nuclease HARBI1 isoform X1 n=1 Tax=Rhagoletis pomonella TaxID=28610 RepID=UPI001781674B|nr:putative nuclease HARBI1 isoform X1 [Rhagoletis pomonella]
MEGKRYNLISRYFENAEVLMTGAADIEAFLNNIPSSSSSETSSSSEESEDEKRKAFEDFCEVIDGYSEEEFESHMRLRRSTAELLIERYASSILPKTHSGGRESLPPKKRVFIYIWYLSNAITFRKLADLFRVSISTVWSAVNSVSAWIISVGHEYIKWPEGTMAKEIQKKFQAKSGIPGVIGVIDCTHIRIKTPRVNKENYLNRKNQYSLVLQAVVDADKRFIDITCGEPGSLNDIRVLRRSNLYATAQSDLQNLFPNNSFILGDLAYPSTSWLVSPFKEDGNLTESQRHFNEIHTSTCGVVKNAFGLLKTRFRRLLHFTEQTNLNFVVNIIVSACILHNVCIASNDSCIEVAKDEGLEPGTQDGPLESNFPTHGIRRDLLFEYLLQLNKI